MAAGKFFFLDPYSHEEKLQHIFRYRKITKKNQTDSKLISPEDSYPEYPIYVTLNPEAITFHFIGLKFLKRDPNNENRNHRDLVRSQHHEALILPLSHNLQIIDELTEILKRTINESIEFDSKIYHWEEDFKEDTNDEITKDVTFSTLERNVKFSTEVTTQNSANLFMTTSLDKLKESNNELFYLPKRELILDFLFDLEHSSVFRSSPYFQIIETKMKECFLVEAIFAKCDYYYCRQQYSKYFFYAQEGEGVNALKNEWSKLLEISELSWIKVINRDESLELFQNSNGWFYNVEKEMKAVIFNDNPQIEYHQIFYEKNLLSSYNNIQKLIDSFFGSIQFRRLGNLFDKLNIGLPVIANAIVFATIIFFYALFIIPISFSHFVLVSQHQPFLNVLLGLFILLFGLLLYLECSIFPLKKNLNWGPFKREKWEEEIKKSIELLEQKDEEKYKTERQNFHRKSYNVQRIVNNFFLQKFNLAHAFRNSIPIEFRKVVSIGGLFIAGIISAIIFRVLWFKIFPQNDILSNNYLNSNNEFVLHFEIITYGILIMGILLTIGMALSNVLYRYVYIKEGGSNIFINPKRDVSILILLALATFSQLAISKQAPNTIFLYFFLVALGLFFLLNDFDKISKKGKKIISFLCVIIIYLTINNPIVVIITLLFFLLVFQLLGKKRKVPRLNFFTFNLLLPRLQMGIVASWIILVATEELWKANIRIDTIVLVMGVLLLSLVAFFYLAYIMSNRSFYLDWKALIFRGGFLIFYGFLISFLFGIVSMSIIGKNMLYNSDVLSQWFEYYPEEVVDGVLEDLNHKNIYLENMESIGAYCEREHFKNITRFNLQNYTGESPNLIFDKIYSSLEHQKQTIYEKSFLLSKLLNDTTIFSVKDSSLNSGFQGILSSVAFPKVPIYDSSNIKINRQTLRRDFLETQEALIASAKEFDVNRVKVISYQDSLRNKFNNFKNVITSFEIKNNFLMNRLKYEGCFIERDLVYQLGFAQKHQDEINQEKEPFHGKILERKIGIYPRLLILNTVLALFVGIFINVVTQDKGLTEPL